MAEVFRYGGVDLRTAGIYMAVADGILSAPPTRGANLLIAYQAGTRWAKKNYGERHIVLTGDLGSVVSRVDFQLKADQLKALFPLGAGEQKLEVQSADGTFRYAMAEVINTMGLQWATFPTRSSPYSIELVASDPFWYGSALECSQARQAWYLDGFTGVNFDDGAHWLAQTSQYFAQILTAQNTIVEASNAGTTYTRKPVFHLTGTMASPRIINQRNGYSVQINANVPAGALLVLDCGAQQATINDQPVAPSLITLGAGQVDWMRLESGDNPLLVVTGVSPSAVAYQALYSPAFL